MFLWRTPDIGFTLFTAIDPEFLNSEKLLLLKIVVLTV